MPLIDEMKESRFLGKADLGKPMLATIRGIKKDNVAKKDATPEMKWCLLIQQSEKPMILNSTNRELLAHITGSRNTDDWIGKTVVIYHDPTISFGGELKGGIRVRAPKNQAPAAPVQPAVSDLDGEVDPDIGF